MFAALAVAEIVLRDRDVESVEASPREIAFVCKGNKASFKSMVFS